MYLKKYPLVTYMLQSADAEAMLADITNAVENGADAIGMQLEGLQESMISADFIKHAVEAANGKPLYVTNYRRGSRYPEKSDEVLAKELLTALDCGALIIDIPGNMFSEDEIEITYDHEAIKKQREFIEEIHKRGGIALMSSHMLKYMPRDKVYELAKVQESRGADIAKIVTNADTEKELTENLIISAELQNMIDIPYLFLCNGKCCAKHRMLSAALGSCMMLCSTELLPKHNQPNLGYGKELFELIDSHRRNLGEI